jgi:Mrp family chromosome partitioning ATPase
MSRNFDILQGSDGILGPQRPETQSKSRSYGAESQRNGRTVAQDEVMKLVQRVFILPGGAKAPQAVAFCSVERGAGCTWVCAHASEVLADQISGSVCVVDANFRSPSLHDYFRFKNGPGFADAVKDAEMRPAHEFARRASGSHLWLITAGSVNGEPNGSLNPARLRARIKELRDEFDFVLFDTSAILAHGDCVLLGQLTDGIILVVGSNSTRREPARMAKESFDAASVPILGAVLNRRTFPIPEVIYRNL